MAVLRGARRPVMAGDCKAKKARVKILDRGSGPNIFD
jgi:hypothetical protein